MNPHDRLTIVRNRHRARDLRIFRARVLAYFEQFEYDESDLPVDWQKVRALRAEINRLLPRIVQIVQAADLGAASPGSAQHPAARALDILNNIFSDRYAHGAYQEILDVTDMAIGVYDTGRSAAWIRTINPFHYVTTALGFVFGLPRRAFAAIGIGHPRGTRIRPHDLTTLESMLARMAGAEELIERRFTEMREWQSRAFGEQAGHITDLAERMDFLERVLAQERPVPRLKAGERKASTPV